MVGPQYKEEVLEWNVSVKFIVGNRRTHKFFPGIIKKVEMRINDRSGLLESRHFVNFDDGDSKWIDLQYMESIGALKWPRQSKKMGQTTTTTTTTAAATKITQQLHPTSSSNNNNNRGRKRRATSKVEPVEDEIPSSSSAWVRRSTRPREFPPSTTESVIDNTTLKTEGGVTKKKKTTMTKIEPSLNEQLKQIAEPRKYKEKVLKVGDIVYAKYHLNKSFYWGKIVSFKTIPTKGKRYHVRFHDGDESPSVSATEITRGICYVELIRKKFWSENLPPPEYLEELSSLSSLKTIVNDKSSEEPILPVAAGGRTAPAEEETPPPTTTTTTTWPVQNGILEQTENGKDLATVNGSTQNIENPEKENEETFTCPAPATIHNLPSSNDLLDRTGYYRVEKKEGGVYTVTI